MADAVIRERIMADPELRRMMDEMSAAMGGYPMDHAGTPEASAEARAAEFIVRLLSDPAVEARIHADPVLHRIWSDPDVQRRLAELRAAQSGGVR